ncbi:uncharacterized protein LOC125258067 [Megalobrama amblycephala]|uniref:uncharacterized protein LOC125258067 n=1 Tax=Megalobrama amblycephala TaxID=75352 RepID=UPI0020146C94|nr:uncharacterized protein LOC125258067 [Megalobrama amblycephala]
MAAQKLYLTLILITVCLDKRNEFDDHPRRRHPEGLASRDWLHQCTLSKNTADGKVLVSSDSSSSPEFIQELLPSAERTALLYHLSYLCLGSFPEQERLIRERALKTQLLFGSSEALLLKCVGMSRNLVTLLLPSLKVAAEKNKPELALKFLEKAKGWISDIITDVKEIVKKYDEHNTDVASLTSNFNKEKEEAKKKEQVLTGEMKELQKIIDDLEAKLLSINKQIEDYEKKIEEKNLEIRELISNITSTMKEKQTCTGRCTTGFDLYSMIVPFAERIINYIFEMISSSEEEVQLRALRADLTEITEAQKSLKKEERHIQDKLMDNQLKLIKLQTENGQMPSITLLDDVQQSLSRIQKSLVQLQNFWEKVGSLLDTMKESTFTGEIWIEDLTDMKEEFLKSIYAAEEEWTQFGNSCKKGYHILSVQANQAYRFLEISPSSLSEEERQKEYESVKEKLENI